MYLENLHRFNRAFINLYSGSAAVLFLFSILLCVISAVNGCTYILYFFLLVELAVHPACRITWPHVFRCCGDWHCSHALTETGVLQRELWGRRHCVNEEEVKYVLVPVLLVHLLLVFIWLIVLCMEAALYGRPETLAYNPRGVMKFATISQPYDRLVA